MTGVTFAPHRGCGCDGSSSVCRRCTDRTLNRLGMRKDGGVGSNESGSGSEGPRDLRGRPLRDLRISVTDRCNFRCRYCMPRETFGPDHAFLPRSELLSFEEIARVVGVLA